MRWIIAGEIAITIVIGGGAFAVLRQQPHATFWLIWVGVYIATVAAFALWNRRGTAHPAALTTRDCIDLLALRCHRRLRSARFTLLMVAIHAPVAAVLLLAGESTVPDRLARATLIALVLAALTAGALIMRARARRELTSLTTLRSNLDLRASA